ncbi:hypothetical protein [Muricoccus nepalensis]|uniref:hypothetical protein n=1 Tax=Muricoccus nepalensis TaxID=1854500 RepID=UPI00112745B6|nr:hypothetical protein [Roseomonas nepalensis]
MATTVRAFNEMAVPGVGGVWYGRQILLALLGIHLAETVRRQGRSVSNITTANAVEALAVWCAYKRHGKHPRLPGVRKFGRQSLSQHPTFKLAGTRTFYVSQPMRIRTVDALATLGFVEAPSRRFNVYSCTELGQTLLQVARPEARRTLLDWVNGGGLPSRPKVTIDDLDPTRPLPVRVREILREAFISGTGPDRMRRQRALDWVESLARRASGHTDWEQQPSEIADGAHWADMRAGAAFTRVVAAAAGEIEGGSVLGQVEARMGTTRSTKLDIADAANDALRPALKELRRRASAFLEAGHDPSPGRAASSFCADCAQQDDVALLSRLITRDGRILRLVDGVILAGAAFRGQPLGTMGGSDRTVDPDNDDGSDEPANAAPASGVPPLPEGISLRISNLLSLAADLRAAPMTTVGL